MIGKVTLKATGQELRVIRQVKNTHVTEVIQDALEIARAQNIGAVAIVMTSKNNYYTDFTGAYDELSAGVNLLNTRINNKWDE